MLAPKSAWISILTVCLVLRLKKMDVFFLLMAWPEAASYFPRRSSRCWLSSTVAWQKMKLSSANNRWDIHTPLVQNRMPCNCFLSTAFLIREERPSAHKRNRYGERGSPCFIPLDGVMYPFGSPLMSTEYVAVCTVSMAKWTHCSSNPSFNKIFYRKIHSTQS